MILDYLVQEEDHCPSSELSHTYANILLPLSLSPRAYKWKIEERTECHLYLIR